MGALNTTNRAWGLALIPLLASVHGQAATLPAAGIAGQVNPALQRQQIEDVQRQQQDAERANRVQVPALRGEAAPDQVLPDQGATFVLQGISFNNSVFLAKAPLQDIAKGYVGRPISFSDLNALLRSVNALYEKQGQMTARAVIPPQGLSNGVLRVVLVEAKIDALTWQDRKHVDEDFYDQRLNISRGQTLDTTALMTAIQRFNATTPGPQVTASLAPGQEFGTTRVDLQAFEPDPLQYSLLLNNYGNESTGRTQYGGTLTWFSPTGVADALSAIAVGTEGSTYGSLRYSRPVNRYNGVVYGEVGANTLQIKSGPLGALNIEGESKTYGLGYDHPWWIDEHWLLQGGIAYNHQTSETTIEGLTLSETSDDEVVLRAQMEYRDGPWYGRYEQRLRQANTDNKTTGESASYQLLNGSGLLSRDIGDTFMLAARLGWQFATDSESLPSTLLYQFGGISSVRGYDPGVIASPQGVTVNLESYWKYSERWQPFVFFDYGRAMKLGTADVDLESVGVGLNFNFNKHLSINAVAAQTLKDVVADQDSSQLLVQIVIH